MFVTRFVVKSGICGLKRFPFYKLRNDVQRHLSTKEILYREWGDPAKVLEMTSKKLDVDAMSADEVLVRWLAAPVNPSDINQIQGVYPVKPPLPAIGGNEGCAVVEKVGASVKSLKIGDYVIPARSGLGTWTQYAIHDASMLYRVDNRLPIVSAATLQVNPPTAYRMLKDYVNVGPGDWIVQNGANSAVGRYVIQICRIWNLKSINVVRDRDTIDDLKKDLRDLGANEVFTEEEFAKAWRSFKNIKLAFNCVSGRSSLMLARSLAQDGCLVTYGGMSKQPVQVPTGALIFNDISLRGYWMTRFYHDGRNEPERRIMYNQLTEWIKNGELKEPPIVERMFDENFTKAFDETAIAGEKQIFFF